MNFERITLTTNPKSDVWLCRMEGGDAARVVELFGTDTLPTPFAWRTTPVAVAIAKVQALNPGIEVTHEYAP